ncbi:hypothetical protein BDR26DRAFT_860124 [Obelidium mucronatum]|nr:hypothetical protein BDR26DRAFT_860124 [Obelidium mucronatum]
MADGAGITRYLNESLRITKALQTFLGNATRLRSTICHGASPLKQAVVDLIKGAGKIADARYGFAGTMKKTILDPFSATTSDLQLILDSKLNEIENMQNPLIETFEAYKKLKASHEINKESANEAKEAVAKAQQDNPQKRKELDKLTQKSSALVQKAMQSTQAVSDAQDEHDRARDIYLREVLPNFQKSLVDWTELRNKTIKHMLIEMKNLEHIAVDKAAEANNVGKESAIAIDVQKIVSQFVDTIITKDIEIRKTSATSIRDLKSPARAGKLYVKRNDSPLSPWSIQYSILKNNRLYMFDNADAHQPREVIVLNRLLEGGGHGEHPKGRSQSDRVTSDFAIIHTAHQSLFQKGNCFQLLFHANAAVTSFPLESNSMETSESGDNSFFYPEDDSSILRQSINKKGEVSGDRQIDRRYYFMPVDKEPSHLWIAAFGSNGAKNCWCGKCLSNQPSKLGLRLWILEGASLGVERGSNDNFGVMVRFGGLKMSRTAFKQGPNPAWNEEFFFENVTSCTHSIRLSVNSGLNLDNGDSELGYIFFSLNSMSLERRVENVINLVAPNSGGQEKTSSQPSIKVAYLLTTSQSLPMDSYQELITMLSVPPLEAFQFLSATLPHDHRDEFYDSYLNLLMALSTPILPALTCLIDREISTTDDPNILFRGNSVLTKMLERFMRVVGSDYVKETLQEPIGNIVQNGWTYEIDPNRIHVSEGMDPAEVLEQNWKKLLHQVGIIWSAIDCSVDMCPIALKVIFSRMKASLKKKYAEEKFQQIGISGFIFLRLFCVAILAPKRFGIVAQDPDAPTLRTLTLITKIMQHLANFSQFGAKERHMEYSNEWINSNATDMKTFINDIASLPPNTELPSLSHLRTTDPHTLVSTMHRFLSTQTSVFSNSPNAASPICKSILAAIDKLDSELEQLSRKLLAENQIAQQKYESNIRLRSPQVNPPKRPSSAVETTDKNIEALLLPVQRLSETQRSKTRSQPTISSLKGISSPASSIKQPVPVFVSRPSIKSPILRQGTTTSPQKPTEKSSKSNSERTSESTNNNRASVFSKNRMSMSAECLVDAKYEDRIPPIMPVVSTVYYTNKPPDFGDVHESPLVSSAVQQSPNTGTPTGQRLGQTPDQQKQGISGFMNRFKGSEAPVVTKTGSARDGLSNDASPTTTAAEEKQFTFMTLIGGGTGKKHNHVSGATATATTVASFPRTGALYGKSSEDAAKRSKDENQSDEKKDSTKVL